LELQRDLAQEVERDLVSPGGIHVQESPSPIEIKKKMEEKSVESSTSDIGHEM
jgi:hypothetical protein